ncbi:hypothetical protein [Haloechinothrix halophila]|uniref:hypothetical protein n=1 Tax=Haloechinothrix halophila TaxID=1069073 RepID=UPI00042560F0|nr:hypothetical protein [Haloechinothrix halophila]
MTPERAPARSLRSISGVGCAVFTGTLGHVAAGGHWSSAGVAFAAVLLVGPTWLLCGREQRFPRIAALLLLGQLVTHESFLLVGAATRHAAHHHAASVGEHVPMLAGHLAAAAAVGWWLRLGERRVWRAARTAVTVVRRCLLRLLSVLLGILIGGVVDPHHATPHPPPVRRRRLSRQPILRRGPPVVA